VVEIGEGLTHRNTAGNVHIHVQFFVITEVRGKGQGQSQGIVNDAPFDLLIFVMKFPVEAGGVGDEGGNGRIYRLQARHILGQEDALVGDIEGNQGEGHAAVKDDVGGMWIDIGVEFGQGRGVALVADRSPHDDHVLDCLHEAGLLAEGESEVGEGANGNDGDLSRRRHDVFDEEIDSVLGDGLGGGGRKLGVAQTGVAVGLGGKQGGLHQGSVAALGHRNVTGLCQFQDGEGVDHTLIGGAVAMDNRQPFEREFGRGQCQEDGGGVVDAGIGIDKDALRHMILWG